MALSIKYKYTPIVSKIGKGLIHSSHSSQSFTQICKDRIFHVFLLFLLAFLLPPAGKEHSRKCSDLQAEGFSVAHRKGKDFQKVVNLKMFIFIQLMLCCILKTYFLDFNLSPTVLIFHECWFQQTLRWSTQ